MRIRKELSALLNRLKDRRQGETSDAIFSMVNIEYHHHIYHVEALERRISIQRLPDGVPMLFSTDKGAMHRELAERVFDGFEWELTTLIQND